MRKNILITGQPKSGKSTILKKVVETKSDKVGFYAQEILSDGIRTGFEIVTSNGKNFPLSSVLSNGGPKVSKYFVDITGVDSAVEESYIFSDTDLLYIDEIGQMQLFSEKFRNLVDLYLNAKNTFVATITSVFEDEFISEIKNRNDVILINLNEENRVDMYEFIELLLGKINKARKYINEPDRFHVNGTSVEMDSTHDKRKLQKNKDGWQCSCEFYSKYAICSHVITVEELKF